MNVKTAGTAGFCFGVQRAVDKAYELCGKENRTIYTLGPIIHNEQVVADLGERGAVILESPGEYDKSRGGVVIIRSHGVGREIYRYMEENQIPYVDMTCPFVLKIHRRVRQASGLGEHVVIMGNPGHPEVQGICGWCEGPFTVLENRQQAGNFSLEKGKKVCVVSQTTFNYNKFKELVEIIEKKRYDISVFNTICNATKERQCEAEALAAESDTMLVIGGRHSSNTQKLYEICKKKCGNTYYIQTLVDLDSEMFRSSSCVGITAGASTPKKIIEEVSEHVRIKF